MNVHMVQVISISEARRQLPALVKAIEKDISRSFVIEVRNQPIAMLTATRQVPRQGAAVKALLRLAKPKSRPLAKQNSKAVTSENFKDSLYGE